MAFSDLKKPEELQRLNEFLADKSYIQGFQPSSKDVEVLDQLPAVIPESCCHVLRWRKHLNSFSWTERRQLSGQDPEVGLALSTLL